MSQKFLVIGATGKQGGAVIKALLDAPPTIPPIHIFALTRNIESNSAKRLVSTPNVTVIQGDPAHASDVFAKIGAVNGVFCVTVAGKDGAEEEQATPLIDASIKHGVKHFVFSSGERGGPGVSEVTPTAVPNLAAKYRIECYIKEQTAKTDMKWTILRPTTFMEMLRTDFHGAGFGVLWYQIGSKPLQMVSVQDIGYFGALSLLNPEKYAGQSMGLAGDELNYEQASKIFNQVTGKKMPKSPCIIGKGLKFTSKDLGSMFAWLETDGYNVDIPSLRNEHPQLLDFATWLKENSGFVDTEENAEA